MTQANGNANGSAAPETNGYKKQVVDISVALNANNLAAVPGLAQDISSLSAAAAEGNEQTRLELVEKARQLVRSLEKPRETMLKHVWAQVQSSVKLHVRWAQVLTSAARCDSRPVRGCRHRPLRCPR